jgi:hypothetical protein
MHIVTGPGGGGGGGGGGRMQACAAASHTCPGSHAQLTAGLMTTVIANGPTTNAHNEISHTKTRRIRLIRSLLKPNPDLG